MGVKAPTSPKGRRKTRSPSQPPQKGGGRQAFKTLKYFLLRMSVRVIID
jgi:hypothetical protein